MDSEAASPGALAAWVKAWMQEVAVWSIQPDIREMGTPDVAISADTEHALICAHS